MVKETFIDLYNRLIKLSDEEIFKLAEDNNLYEDWQMKCLAEILEVSHSKYNNIELERKIIFDIINRLLLKNKETYDIHELINVTISENQLKIAINDISKNSIYFQNESKYRYLFFDNNKDTNTCDQNYFFNIIKTILASYAIKLYKKKLARSNKQVYVYMLTMDDYVRNRIIKP